MSDTQGSSVHTQAAAQALGDAVVKIYAEWKSADSKGDKISATVVTALTDAFKIVNEASGVLNEAKTNPSDFITTWVQAAIPVVESFFKK